MQTLEPGDTLDERFLLTELVSGGGDHLVFRAHDLADGSGDVAVKLPRPEHEGDPVYRRRLEREERLGLRLRHPGLPRFVPLTGIRSRPYLAMEYVRGRTLAHVLEALAPLPEPDALRIGSELCAVLGYLHGKKLAHGDLKPQNVLLTDHGVRLLDLGLAARFGWGRGGRAHRAATMGTPDYIAPERARGKEGDARSDLYSLGAMLFEMLTGQAPFQGDSALVIMNARLEEDAPPLRDLNPAVSPEAAHVVLHAMARAPSERYADAESMRASLDCAARAGYTVRATA